MVDEPRHDRSSLLQYQALSLDSKVRLSVLRIRQWYELNDGDVAVAYSGGLDSTVLGHLVQSVYPDVPLVFHDSMLEFPENREQARQAGAVFTKAGKSPAEVFEQYGYPVVSKETSQKIYEARRWPNSFRANVLGIKKNGEPISGRKISGKWRFLLNAPFPVSHLCCEIFKKGPSKRYEKDTGRTMMVGIRADESESRKQNWLKHGCNSFDTNRKRSWPIAFWMHTDVLAYIRANNVRCSALYDMGYKRSGCMFCMFGCHLEEEPNRFQRLKLTHPKQWAYCLDKLGLRRVLEYMCIPYEPRTRFF